MTTSNTITKTDLANILNEVLPSGGVQTVTFTPTTGSSYSGYGGCYYQTLGHIVHIHLSISGLTQNTSKTVYTMPSGLRPPTQILYNGSSGSLNLICNITVNADGTISVYPVSGTYCIGDIFYFA